MPDLSSPPAARIATPRWLDLRLLAGVALVLVSVVAGAAVVGSADRSVRVYVARHALAPGQHLQADDVAVGRVRLYGRGGAYVSADGPAPTGYLVVRPVGARELLPVAALVAGPDAAGTRHVAVPVSPGHLPAGIRRGDLVDVYVTAKAAGAGPVPEPELVLAAAAVDAQEGGARTFGASGSTLTVVLSVPEQRVGQVVQAVQSGAIDLVRVPRAPASALPGAAS